MPPLRAQGRVIAGRYNLTESIGRGAMGVVWRARDSLLDRDVAIKEVFFKGAISDEDRENAYKRTMREARTAARLSHSGVVTIYDVAEEDGRPWIIMEFVPSRSLEKILASEGPLSPRRACRIGQQLLAALAHAHAAGVLHRDVKPGNVLIADDPDGERAVLTDFGIAQFAGDPRLTQTGMVMGSPGFTAPERIRGGTATPASDLWSLGATLFAAVEGHGPYEKRGGAITTMTAIINEDAPAAQAAGPLGPLIAALLHRNPRLRPPAGAAARMFTGVLPLLPPDSLPVRRGARPALAATGPSQEGSTSPDGTPAPAGTVPGTIPGTIPGALAKTPDTAADTAADPPGPENSPPEAPEGTTADDPADEPEAGARQADAPEEAAPAGSVPEAGSVVPEADVTGAEETAGEDTEEAAPAAKEPGPSGSDPAPESAPPSDKEANEEPDGEPERPAEPGAPDASAAPDTAPDTDEEEIPTACSPAIGAGTGAGRPRDVSADRGPANNSPADDAPGDDVPSAGSSSEDPVPSFRLSAALTEEPPTMVANGPSAITATITPTPVSRSRDRFPPPVPAPPVPVPPGDDAPTRPQPTGYLLPGPGPGRVPVPRRGQGRRAVIAVAVLIILVVIGAAVALMTRNGLSTTGNTASASTSLPGAVKAINSPAAAPPPGWTAKSVSPAVNGTAGGFTVAVPPEWAVRQRSVATYLDSPAGGEYLDVDLTQHSHGDMLAEAQYIETNAVAEGHLPGYRRIDLRRVTIRGSSGAFWSFTWKTSAGVTMEVNDLLFDLPTSTGTQSYAVYFTAPASVFPQSQGLPLFDQILQTFKPVTN